MGVVADTEERTDALVHIMCTPQAFDLPCNGLGYRKGYGGPCLGLTALPLIPFDKLLFVEFLLTTDVSARGRICTSVLPWRAVTGSFDTIGFLFESFEDATSTLFIEISENSSAPVNEVPDTREFGDG